MALPSPTKVAGPHFPIYEAYYSVVDPKNVGHVPAMDAAKFLKRSFLSDVILSKIWDLSDPQSRGYLDKSGMFVAMKLCALAQQGHTLNISNILMDLSPPKMGDVPKIKKVATCPQSAPTPLITNWSIDPQERAKYRQLFINLQPVDGYLPGNKVKGVLMDSKLPLETLGKIWDLADMDKDGKLNEHEFTVAMHLVYKALENKAVPNVLPSELQETSNINIEPQLSPKPPQIVPSITPELARTSPMLIKDTKTSDWVVSQEDQIAADKLFVQADKDLDGFVSGLEIKDVFIQSGLSQPILAQIWGLCDTYSSGKLNKEQFALSMWLIKRKLNGIEVPDKLNPEMIPPTLRKKTAEPVVENNNQVTYSNPELDMISKDITEIIKEKLLLEQNISQKEADIKIKNGEIKSLQSEFDTLAATLRQLDNQKGEAQKRLNDLKAQVDKLQVQATDQEATLHVQEEELNSKRQAMESLKQEEQKLESQQNEYRNQLNNLSKQLQNIQLQMSQTKANVTDLKEQQRQIIDGITQCDSALAVGDPLLVPDSTLMFEAKLNDNEGKPEKIKSDYSNNNRSLQDQAFSAPNGQNVAFEANFDSQPSDGFGDSFGDQKIHDPFNDAAMQSKKSADTHETEDPFGEDPFAALHAPVRATSPSPALPPKKSKQPPPRPAPPKSVQMGMHKVPQTNLSSTSPSLASDSFTNKPLPNFSADNTNDFADFANFDLK